MINAQEIDQMIVYKNYTIKSFPLQLIANGQWKTHISISWERDGIRTSRPFSMDKTFATQEEAHVYGIEWGQRIIDRKVADSWVD